MYSIKSSTINKYRLKIIKYNDSKIDKHNKKQILNNLMSIKESYTKIMITHDIELADKFYIFI